MATYRVRVEALKPVVHWFIVKDGDDWDGRPVSDKFDAGDYAYDLALETLDKDLDWQVAEVIEEEK